MTLFTGLHPTAHGVTRMSLKLSKDVPTLPETLRRDGYRTFAYTGGRYLAGTYGFRRGFEEYDGGSEELRFALLLGTERIKSFADDERYFLFIHAYDVHCPYDPPEPYASMFRTRPAEDYLETKGRCGRAYYNRMSLTPGQVRFLSDQYDASVRYVDDLLKEFFAFLESRRELDDTIIVLLSDHGEELNEHGRFGHRDNLFVECLKVPLILVAPGLRPRVVNEPVGLVDVMPTLLEMLGIPAPRQQGRSLMPLITGRPAGWAGRTMFSEDRDARSAMFGPYHFIVRTEPRQRMLFDLRTDPTEQQDIADSHPERVAELERRLNRHLSQLEGGEGEPRGQLSPEELKKLRTLGYVD